MTPHVRIVGLVIAVAALALAGRPTGHGVIVSPRVSVEAPRRTQDPKSPPSAPALALESLQLRLLRSIYTGTIEGLDPAHVDRETVDSGVDFATSVLARASRHVRGVDFGFPDWPLSRLLDRLLRLELRSSNTFSSAAMPHRGFGGDDLVYALVYALVVAGGADPAIDTLEPHLGATDRHHDFKRAVVLQALRNIGSRRADDLIRRAGEQGKDGNLPENLLADLHYPFHSDLAQRWSLIPPGERTRANLLSLASTRCGEKAALAVYFLGYLGTPADEDRARAELALLRDLTKASCFHTRFFAVRALALRSPERVAFWTERFRGEGDAWQRAQLARIGFARFGDAFLAPALQLLAEESSQYVQWELMHGSLELRDGGRFRDWWDIWQTTALQIRLTFPEGEEEARSDDMHEILEWLEAGARPRDRWVRNHLLYGIGKHVRGRNTRRLLGVFDSLPEKAEAWWILAPLQDPLALPLLRFWLTTAPESRQRDELARLVERLGSSPGPTSHAGEGACCAPTRACLATQVEAASVNDAHLSSDTEARAWLAAQHVPPAIALIDTLGRVATVRRAPDASAERWEHVFGCWRRTEPAPGQARTDRAGA